MLYNEPYTIKSILCIIQNVRMKNIPLDHNYIQNEIFVCVRIIYIF